MASKTPTIKPATKAAAKKATNATLTAKKRNTLKAKVKVAEYVSPLATPKPVIILGCDAGERNYAYSAVRISLTKQGVVKVDLVATGYVQNTVINLTHDQRMVTKKELRDSLPVEFARYTKEFKQILKDNEPSVVVLERYIGMGRTTRANETINLMLGASLLISQKKSIPAFLIMAVQWKRFFGGKPALTAFYDIAAKKNIKPHTVDTILQALYVKLRVIEGGKWPTPTESTIKTMIMSIDTFI
jgi:hypothetical protein